MRPLRILQTSPFFYPAALATGPANVARAQSKGLALKGHDVTVYTSNTCDSTSALEIAGETSIDGITVYYCASLSHKLAAHRVVLSPQVVQLAKRQLLTFDVVHMHDYRTFDNLIVGICAKRRGVPYVLQAHGTVPRVIGKRGLKTVFDACFGRWLLRNATMSIALSPIEAEQYADAGVYPESIEILPNGVESPLCTLSGAGALFRRHYGIDSQESVILFLGRVHKIKGLDLLLEALHLLRDRLASVRLIIAGPEDGFLHALERKLHSLQLEEYVLLTGNLAEHEKWSALAASDILVLPSLYEAFPVVVLEAWAMGLPVIVTPRNGLADWVQKGGGMVISRDRLLWDRGLFALLTDPEKRRTLGREGRRLVEQHFTWERVVDSLEQIYYGVLGRVGGG